MFKDIIEMHIAAMNINDSSSKENVESFMAEVDDLFHQNDKVAHKYKQNEIDLICSIFSESKIPEKYKLSLCTIITLSNLELFKAILPTINKVIEPILMKEYHTQKIAY